MKQSNQYSILNDYTFELKANQRKLYFGVKDNIQMKTITELSESVKQIKNEKSGSSNG